LHEPATFAALGSGEEFGQSAAAPFLAHCDANKTFRICEEDGVAP
jgi:hypothetical protein